MCAAFAALAVTLVAVLGAVGVLPAEAPAAAATVHTGAGDQAALSALAIHPRGRATAAGDPGTTASARDEVAVPADTGWGKRIVFDMSDQRVWLVDGREQVRRTYLVSGSVTDNLAPGTYSVYSRSRWAVGIDDSGTMEYFVRFTHGANAAIGFHSIPTKDGHLLQTGAMLGTPRSHGCIRQKLADARRLWEFAPIGTKVVVTA